MDIVQKTKTIEKLVKTYKDEVASLPDSIPTLFSHAFITQKNGHYDIKIVSNKGKVIRSCKEIEGIIVDYFPDKCYSSQAKQNQNIERIYILPDEQLFPICLLLPEKYISSFSKYLAHTFFDSGRLPWESKTTISLNNDGSLNFKEAQRLEAEEADSIRTYVRNIKQLSISMRYLVL